jgi:adenine deaminase
MKIDLKEQIAVASGLKKADLVLKGGQIVNVFSGEVYPADVAVHRGTIAGLGDYEGKRIVDVAGKLILPGLIDSHVHIESSMVTPAEFAKAALPRGTTAVVADPHEISNVLGKKGIRYFLDATEGLPIDFFFMLPSCVPATRLETSGARLTAADLRPFLKHKRVLGLAEMMDYPGVLAREPGILKKLERFRDSVIDGHAPGLSGKDLSAYIGAGITSDHECITAREAREKLRLGMTIFIREGSAAKDLEPLLPVVTSTNSRSFCFCTDDLQAKDLLEGGINLVVRKAILLGLDPVTAVQMATINPACHFGMKRRGAVLPGYIADLVVIDDFKSFTVEKVFKNGKIAAERAAMTIPVKRADHSVARNTIRIRPLKIGDIRLEARTGKARIIELIPEQIETRQMIMPIPVRNGFVASDTDRDILRLLVIERHKATGNTGFGLVKGFGLRSGALASTVAHDSHNIIVVGVDDEDILKAVSEIKKLHGGQVVVNKGKILASLPLPVAGLMSDKPVTAVAKRISAVHQAARRLGVTIEGPFSAMAFLALPVIPELKLTDKGLVDVKKFDIVNLFV